MINNEKNAILMDRLIWPVLFKLVETNSLQIVYNSEEGQI